MGNAGSEFGIGCGVLLRVARRIGFVGQARTNHLGPDVDISRSPDVDGKPEPVEQLRTKLPFFRVHGADQHEPGFVAVRHPVALDVHPAHCRRIQQDIDQMVVQQIDLVDVQHTLVRPGQQAWRESMLTITQHLLQVKRTDYPVLGGADRQFNELPAASAGHFESLGQHMRQTADGCRLRGALLSPDEHSPDVWSHCAQHQRQPQPLVAHQRAEGKAHWRGIGRKFGRRKFASSHSPAIGIRGGIPILAQPRRRAAVILRLLSCVDCSGGMLWVGDRPVAGGDREATGGLIEPEHLGPMRP